MSHENPLEKTRLPFISEIETDSLEAQLAAATTSQLRAAAIAACEFALLHTKLHAQLITEAMEILQTRRPAPVSLKLSLKSWVEELDEKCFDLDDAEEEGRVRSSEVRNAFRQARAANAVLYALEDNPLVAAAEAIYEALAATADFPNLEERCLQAISATS